MNQCKKTLTVFIGLSVTLGYAAVTKLVELAARADDQAAARAPGSDDTAVTMATRIGKLEFTHDFANGFPTHATVDKLYDEIDFQRACQAYLWALPIVSFAAWQRVHEQTFGAGNGDMVSYNTMEDKQGILTA